MRKAIGSDLIVSQPPGYLLRVDPERFDLARFERLVAEARRAGEPRERAEKLRAALSLWRGPALEDLAFESFAQTEIARLEEARLEALEERLDADLALGRAGDLVIELEGLVAQHPLRERFRVQLMLALYRAGRQADALAAYQDARRMLLDELGLEPSEELRGLEQAILRQDPLVADIGDARAERAARPADGDGPLLRPRRFDRACARLDPEAYRVIMERYFAAVRAPIERHGGTVEKFIGDAVMAVFGVPELHEDDALRAVRAAVEIRSVLEELAELAAAEWDVPLAGRIGRRQRRGARHLGLARGPARVGRGLQARRRSSSSGHPRARSCSGTTRIGSSVTPSARTWSSCPTACRRGISTSSSRMLLRTRGVSTRR